MKAIAPVRTSCFAIEMALLPLRAGSGGHQASRGATVLTEPGVVRKRERRPPDKAGQASGRAPAALRAALALVGSVMSKRAPQ